MILLGLDIETGAAFNAPKEENFITELGLVLWDTELDDDGAPVGLWNFLINQDKEVHADPADYTGITTEMIKRWGVPLENAQGFLTYCLKQCDYVVAHNGREFDIPIITSDFPEEGGAMLNKKTLIDFDDFSQVII